MPARFSARPACRAGCLRRTVIAAIAVLCLLTLPAHGARREYYFEPLAGEQGLAQHTVNALHQDRRGFVWIATQGGLHRYDGTGVRLYRHDANDPDSLPDSFVGALAGAGDSGLWVGTLGQYVAYLDFASGRFRRYLDPTLDRAGQRGKAVWALAWQPGTGLWVGTSTGVDLLDPASGERHQVLQLDATPASGARVHALTIDRAGQVWVGSDLGLWRIDSKTRHAYRLDFAGAVRSLSLDTDGRLWAGADGLYLVDTERGRLARAWPAVGEGPGDLIVRAIVQDPEGWLWLAVHGTGLVRYEPGRQRVRTVRPEAGLPATLPEATLTSLLLDRSGLLWVGGEARGVSTTDPGGARFRLVMDLSPERDRAAANNVRGLWQAPDGALWIGTDGDGLKRYDPANDRFEDYSEPLYAATTPALPRRELRVFDLEPDADGALWVASNHGLYLLDPTARRATRTPSAPERRDTLPDDYVRALQRSRDGALWVGTFGAGLARRDPISGSWRQLRHVADDPTSLSHDLVNCLLEDRRGRLWVGTGEGLNLIDPATGRVRRYLHDPKDPDSLSGNLVRVLHEAADGTLWIGTHSGLNRLRELPDGRMRFERFGALRGPHELGLTVYGILEDDKGRLWLSGNSGIQRFDPRSGEFHAYGRRDGLQDLEFNGSAQLRLADGQLAFGGIRGLNLFDPARLQESDHQPELALLGVRVGARGDNQIGLLPPASLQVPQSAGVLRLRFAALDYAAPGALLYQYRMDGFDPDWIDAGVLPDATYTNLDAGRYVFRARATNRDGVWSGHELALPVTVTPPWWNSLPAHAFYLLLAGLFAYALWRNRRSRREQERALLAEIREREERLKLALWGSGDEFWDWDVCNNKLHRVGSDQLVGRSRLGEMSTDEWRSQSVHPDDLPRVQKLLQEHIVGQSDVFESEHRIRNARGEWIWVRSRGKVVDRDAEGNPLRIAGTARDITVSRRAERERRIAIEVLRSMSEAVAVVDLDFRFVSVNPAFSRITGYSEEEVLGQPSRLLDSTQHSPDFYRRMRDVLERTGHWAGEMWQRRKDGDEFLGWIEISEVRDVQGARSHFVTVVNDITDKKRAEQELRYLANYDTLTGLPNRALLSERLARAIVRARRQDTRVAVLFLDLDRFKDINDSLGHAAGDRILKAAASRLLATVGASDTVARLGGDEFTVVLEDITDLAAVERVVRDIISAFATPLEIDERHDVTISPSVGISLYPDHGLVPTDLLKFADTAMYQAKAVGRNTYQVYTEAMDAEARRRATVAAALRKALDRGEFRLVFQPRLSLADGRITGAEALLRWHSPELGEVPPTVFIPLAEESGLILPIGEWVLREACLTLKRWRHHGLNDVAMAVNVSVLQLLRGNLPDLLQRVLVEAEVPASRVELEVTESMVMQNAEQTTAALHDLRQMGVSLAIDDFGTGYSSLVYLKRLPIDTLKIDKEFVGDLTRDPDDEAITATVITMAHSLGLNVIAEGVESDQQLAYLREQGCDEVQGFWLSPPLDAHRCLAFMRTWQPQTVSMVPTPY